MSTINIGVLDGTRRVEPGVRGLGVNAGLAGAPLGMRLRGASKAGAPLVGSWKAGDQISDRNGAIWICTTAGTPGTWVNAGAVGAVTGVTAADASVVIGGTSQAPTVATGTLDAIAAQHPPAASVAMNSQKLTGLANGSATADSAAYGQTPAGGSTVTLAQGGTGQTSQQAALNALAGAVTSGQYPRGNGTNVAMSVIQAADLPAATTSAQGAVTLDGTAGDIAALGTRAAGAVGKAADAGHIHPQTGLFVKVADTGNSGTALVNGSQTILSWTAPTDGNLHFLSWAALLHVTSTETGGNVVTTVSGLYTVGNGFSGGAAAAWYTANSNAVVPSGDLFQINQSVALTGGAATVFAQIWAL